MYEQKINFFTEKEEEFVNLFRKIGTKRNVAIVLVFLANVPDASSHDIERGTDLRQPEVSYAIKYLTPLKWIRYRDISSDRKGRPVRQYSLEVPFNEIITLSKKKRKKRQTISWA